MSIYSYICLSLVKLLFDTYDNIQLHILVYIGSRWFWWRAVWKK